jgi:uncharacterized protein YoaH (UPF0181 family)
MVPRNARIEVEQTEQLALIGLSTHHNIASVAKNLKQTESRFADQNEG